MFLFQLAFAMPGESARRPVTSGYLQFWITLTVVPVMELGARVVWRRDVVKYTLSSGYLLMFPASERWEETKCHKRFDRKLGNPSVEFFRWRISQYYLFFAQLLDSGWHGSMQLLFRIVEDSLIPGR